MNSATLDPAAAPVPLQQDAAIIGLVGLAHASSHFSHLLLPLLFPVFMTEFGLSYSQLGLLMTVFFVVSGAGQALAGFAVDRLGARPLLLASMAIFMLACALASWPMAMRRCSAWQCWLAWAMPPFIRLISPS